MAGSITGDLVELRVPLKSKYAAVLRSAVGVMAGAMNFNYDEIMHIRVAVSEVFDWAIEGVTGHESTSGPSGVDVRFAPHTDRLEIMFTSPPGAAGALESEAKEESQALLRSLMGRVEIGADGAVVRMVKYKSSWLEHLLPV